MDIISTLKRKCKVINGTEAWFITPEETRYKVIVLADYKKGISLVSRDNPNDILFCTTHSLMTFIRDGRTTELMKVIDSLYSTGVFNALNTKLKTVKPKTMQRYCQFR
jgi:hypothetical protein